MKRWIVLLILIFSEASFCQPKKDAVKLCAERGHIWETVSNGETRTCLRCGTTERYAPPCDTLVVWPQLSDTIEYEIDYWKLDDDEVWRYMGKTRLDEVGEDG